MRKIILLIAFICSSLFANSLEERVAKLEKEVELLKKELNKSIASQKELSDFQKKLVEDRGSCNRLKLVKFNYSYDNGFYKGYKLFYTLKNGYKKEIKFLKAYITIKDKEDNILIEDFIKRKLFLKPTQTATIETYYKIDFEAGLSQYLKDTPLKNLEIIFKPSFIIFKDNSKISCKN